MGLAVVALGLSGCINANDVAMQLGRPPNTTINTRALESRKFDTKDEAQLLAAATQAMQDLGFIITESSSEGGLLTGTKSRDATEAGQVAGQIALTIVLAALGTAYTPVWDTNQTIHATLVVYQPEAGGGSVVRAAFDRIVVDTQRRQRAELITDPVIYQDFFKAYSAALSLEAMPL